MSTSTLSTATLSQEQREFFIENGFVLLPGAVPLELVARARQSINHAIGQGVPEEELQTWTQQSWFPPLSRTPVIADLFNESSLLPIAQSLLGEDKVERRGHGQLALRFPHEPDTEPRRPGPHIDGMHSSHNGVPKGTLSSFTALVGVFLTEVARPYAGNFCVWPGTHRLFAEYFREHGAKCLLEENKLPKIDLPEPIQIEAKPGDAVVAHYLLGHGVAWNTAPDPRYAVFYRLQVPEHKDQRVEVLTDLWREWPGLGL